MNRDLKIVLGNLRSSARSLGLTMFEMFGKVFEIIDISLELNLKTKYDFLLKFDWGQIFEICVFSDLIFSKTARLTTDKLKFLKSKRIKKYFFRVLKSKSRENLDKNKTQTPRQT